MRCSPRQPSTAARLRHSPRGLLDPNRRIRSPRPRESAGLRNLRAGLAFGAGVAGHIHRPRRPPSSRPPHPPSSPQRKRACGPVLPVASHSTAGGRLTARPAPCGRSARRCSQHRRLNASISESATARWDRLQSSCQRTTKPTRSRQASISYRGVSQTVSASGIFARSASTRGRPSSRVKANRPPATSALDISRSRVSLSGNASIVSNRSTTSNGPAGIGGIRGDLEVARKIARTLTCDLDGAGAEVHPQIRATQLLSDEPPGTGHTAAQIEHGDSARDAGLTREGQYLSSPHEALLLDELAGNVRRARARCRALRERRALVLLHDKVRARRFAGYL